MALINVAAKVRQDIVTAVMKMAIAQGQSAVYLVISAVLMKMKMGYVERIFVAMKAKRPIVHPVMKIAIVQISAAVLAPF